MSLLRRYISGFVLSVLLASTTVLAAIVPPAQAVASETVYVGTDTVYI
jgi:heme/copper-type cytochrome/quinol oxidase subunit 4